MELIVNEWYDVVSKGKAHYVVELFFSFPPLHAVAAVAAAAAAEVCFNYGRWQYGRRRRRIRGTRVNTVTHYGYSITPTNQPTKVRRRDHSFYSQAYIHNSVTLRFYSTSAMACRSIMLFCLSVREIR